MDDARDLWLPDGRLVRVRPLRPGDREIYERAVLDLSPRSRYLRFLAPIDKPSERLLDFMTYPDVRCPHPPCDDLAREPREPAPAGGGGFTPAGADGLHSTHEAQLT